MKKILFIAGIAFLLLSAFIIPGTSGIHGTISPADAAKKVWAVSTTGTDTVSIVPSSGAFSLDVKPGTWKILVEAAKPYKDAVVSNITVEEGKYTDAGEVKLTSDQ
jgi:uncharacterized membrane protein